MLLTRLDQGFSPMSLFANGEPGALFYLDDALTVSGDGVFLFQDSVGTTPVTAVGQAVGLYLDRRFSLARGVDQAINGGFADGSNWSAAAGWAIGSGVAAATATSTSLFQGTAQGFTPVQGQAWEVEFDWTQGGGTLNVAMGLGTAATFTTTGHKRCTLTCGATPARGLEFYGGAVTGSLDNVTYKLLSGNHRTASGTTRPLLQQNGTTGKLCLVGDGSDDFMMGPMDLSATNKLTVIGSLRKLSDAASAMYCELSATVVSNNGTFQLLAPVISSEGYRFSSKGTGLSQAGSGGAGTFAAPITNVVTGIGDIAADVAIQRVNGAQVGSAATDQGTGNYGNHTQYYLSRGGASLYFGGEEYALIIRGAATDAATLAAAERWAASKAGISF